MLGGLVRAGVRHVVLSPGSRSQALALVAAELEARGLVRLHVRIDERVAGFTALGIGRETGIPAAVICTSGTAVANLLPAALEAHHAGVPLLLLTGDRPPELRGIGANQTTRQADLFAGVVRSETDLPVPDELDPAGTGAQTVRLGRVAADAVAAARGTGGRPAGPVHLNVPAREPLAGRIPSWLVASAPGDVGEADGSDPGAGEPHVLARGPRTIVVAGADAGPAAEELAHEGAWPLVAEVVSGARFGRALVHGYRTVLRALGPAVQRVVVFGHPTLSRETTALLSRADVEVIAVQGPGERLDLNGATRSVARVRVEPGEPDAAWRAEWLRASRDAAVDVSPPAPDAAGLASAVPHERLGAIQAELEVIRAPVDRAALADAVWRATWPHDRLVFGSSRLVRVADEVVGGKRIPVHANRGLAGIDGTIATAAGIALASQAAGAAGVTRVLLGDLAFLHDVGALLLPPEEAESRIQVIVGNDGGGTIFDQLEVAGVADAAAHARVQYTPQAVDLAALAAAYGWAYRRVTTRTELDQVLTAPHPGRSLIEVPLPR
ncbi:2-succinyl-5-enolpyruvyl-6-hydroxy-3-cyclohexene-1-carboxylic-acid synthase [Microbacterium sp. X-17]|uniref:2-succinyl-5-enolpyruvyl-6-hydroxy-3- cyclohexene-1-carboxylic-acid synthase n=1 Tax=Microbacterium sp. X-17 TaxID=3144404 RepID=UPI0031F5CF46